MKTASGRGGDAGGRSWVPIRSGSVQSRPATTCEFVSYSPSGAWICSNCAADTSAETSSLSSVSIIAAGSPSTRTAPAWVLVPLTESPSTSATCDSTASTAVSSASSWAAWNSLEPPLGWAPRLRVAVGSQLHARRSAPRCRRRWSHRYQRHPYRESRHHQAHYTRQARESCQLLSQRAPVVGRYRAYTGFVASRIRFRYGSMNTPTCRLGDATHDVDTKVRFGSPNRYSRLIAEASVFLW